MLTAVEVEFLRNELAEAQNPLFFHDSDGDGLGAFLALYRIHRKGKSYALGSTSCLGKEFLRKVEEINPDKIFVLDIPLMKQEFVDKANRPIFWLDHHPVQEIKNARYFNPRIKDPLAYIPTTRMAYQVSEKPEDIWIAMAGCLADFYLPDFIDEFIKQYPQWLEKVEDLPTMLFKREIGKLPKLLFFLQKGPTSEVSKSIKILTRIKSPDEIFKQETPQGKFIYAGSSEAYGDPLEHPQKESYWGNVNPNGPRSCYDESKRLGETICGVHQREFGHLGAILVLREVLVGLPLTKKIQSVR